ncbi:uncharacterized protein EI97DRAFT_457473 [Westerdykella ornata]|uniref:Uncharacterized protein n=1 Tax=Westerdykella ornata TaxID=318751 RepID=A0A6A6JR72_WESOR|nr:uncharacterized protein EI97DRAFT_457473 [Westerdykella ornata]KAF2277459.1 hypothetical protein EI97DRAFT_457473 [Westerdykella ornata]
MSTNNTTPQQDPDLVDDCDQTVPPYSSLQSPPYNGTDPDDYDTDSSQESLHIVVNRGTHIQGDRYVHVCQRQPQRSRPSPRINLTINANVTLTGNNILATRDMDLYRQMTGLNNPPARRVSTTVQLPPPTRAREPLEVSISQGRSSLHYCSTSVTDAPPDDVQQAPSQLRRQASIIGHAERFRRMSQSSSAVEGAEAIQESLNTHPPASRTPERNGHKKDNDDDLYSGS